VISLPTEYLPNAHKKRAVRYGINNCKGEIIVTTDADCTHIKEWLETMLSYYDEDTGFISGPVEFKTGKTLFEKIQRIEFAGLILSGAGLIGIDRPAICNAANASYKKAAYNSVNGFDDNLNLSSGDDEILMQKIWKESKYKVKFCMNKNAVVTTSPNGSLKEFYHQRKRWASKGLFYKNKFLKLKLVLIALFYFSLLAQLLLGIFLSPSFLISFSVSFLLKIIIEYKILKKGADLLFGKHLLKSFFTAEIFHIPYIIIFSIAGIFGNYQWKERKVKR
jgi:cellulose synthase/poly-beta-1,6-N-acetylglucosamine synthase-like glycosyltransferase